VFFPVFLLAEYAQGGRKATADENTADRHSRQHATNNPPPSPKPTTQNPTTNPQKTKQSKVFSNTYGFDDDDAGRGKALGDFADAFFRGGGAGALALLACFFCDGGGVGPDHNTL
jgi:hypothetical protein